MCSIKERKVKKEKEPSIMNVSQKGVKKGRAMGREGGRNEKKKGGGGKSPCAENQGLRGGTSKR